MHLFQKIQKQFPSLSHSQRKIGEHISSDGASVSFASLNQLARSIGVSESSIVRFAQRLGYEGYPELREELQQGIKDKLGLAARMDRSISTVQGQGILEGLFQRDIQLIEETMREIKEGDLRQAVDLIWGAQRVFIMGLQASFALAYFLYFRLIRLQIDARLISFIGNTPVLEQIALIRRNDLVVAIEFAHIPKELSLVMDYAVEAGAKILGITYPPTTEIAQKAHVVLIAKRGTHAVLPSLAAPFSLLNALTIEVANARKARSLKALSRLDRMKGFYRDYGARNGRRT